MAFLFSMCFRSKYTEIHCQRNFSFFLSISKTDNYLKTILANYHLHSMSIFLHYKIRLRGYSHLSTKVLFPCCTCTCWDSLKTLYTLSVCKVKCLNLQRNAKNLDWFSVPVHRTLLRDRHHCTKRSTPLQLSQVCFTLQKQDGQIEEKVQGQWLICLS